jgi:hypothetical protein
MEVPLDSIVYSIRDARVAHGPFTARFPAILRGRGTPLALAGTRARPAPSSAYHLERAREARGNRRIPRQLNPDPASDILPLRFERLA